MSSNVLITNDRHAREVSGLIDEMSRATSSEQVLKSVVSGLPPEVMDGIRRALTAERTELSAMLDAYLEAKRGNLEPIKARAQNDLGEMLIVARIAKGWSQRILPDRSGCESRPFSVMKPTATDLSVLLVSSGWPRRLG